MVFRCLYCTVWIPMLHFISMWNIFFYISLYTSNYNTTLLIKLSKTISIKYNLKQNITSFSSIAHGIFNNLTAPMVNDLNDTHHHKPTLALQYSKSLDNFSDNPTNSINNHTGLTSPPPFYTKRPNKLHMTRYKVTSEKTSISSIQYYSQNLSTSSVARTISTFA